MPSSTRPTSTSSPPLPILTLLLVVPSISPTLRDEIATMGWTVADLGGGYRRIDGAVYALYVAVTDEVAEAEHDEFLRLFSHLEVADPVARHWARHWIKETAMTTKIEDIPGYYEVAEKFLADLPPRTRVHGLTPEQRMEGLAPEQRVEGLTPEQRLAGLSDEERLLTLSDETLRQLPDTYLRTLSAQAQEALRRRIGRPAAS